MIRAITFNCQGLKSSIHDIQALCSTYDLIFIQESWLFQFELTLLSEIDTDFEGFGISAIDDSTNIVRGRPYGGTAILIRKQYRSIAQFHTYNCSRLLGVQLTCNDLSLLFISVYMPYQCDDNYELFMEYVGKLSALIEESPTSYVTILGDFNAVIDTQFEAELRELCSNLDLVVSDCDFYGRTSGMFTHVSNAHGSTSWLDHVICSRDMQAKFQSVSIIDMLRSSDHVPISAVFDFITTPAFIDTSTCPSNKVNFNWEKATDKDLLDYKYLTRMYYNDIHVVDVVKCHDVNCKSHELIEQIDQLYTQLCSVLKDASDDSIPVCKIHTHHDYTVPGFNEFAEYMIDWSL